MLRKILIFFLLFFVLGMFAARSYFLGYWRFNYPRASDYPVRGIDVSHHQGTIDWNKIREQGIRFVYMKATEGDDFKDPRFAQNWDEAGKAGLVRGAYHFFTASVSGAQQAKNFLETCPPTSLTLPPVVDFEIARTPDDAAEKEEILKNLSEFLRLIEERYGTPPVLYATRESYRRYLAEEPERYRFWYRNIFGTPRLSDKRRCLFWQYANNGRLPGIDERVDLNIFMGSSAEFTGLIRK